MIHLIGAGGHARVVIDALLESGADRSDIVVRDGRSGLTGADLLGAPVETPEIDPSLAGRRFHIAIGSADARERLAAAAVAAGAEPASIVHPAAVISRFATVEPGSFIAALSVIGPVARIGRHVIVNHGAVVDHDCLVGDFSHIAPNASLGGGVAIGARCLIGAGAVVLPGVTIGDDVTVGAGAVVTRDIGPDQTWTGVPAAPKAP
ncbi:NeuD/PglB/VioB family sugar acetyltransferase [Brevundimonas lenta]|uniref:Sugar O-acyltransferase (Sialic acid O-acetyltransferase NeuD family) n=1 Tax=Brevundimonas lenta TaxID=424796 RepID=A0A7W6JFD8_9CAUL|nr:NeuD/PglB/VioB family sugar acetyltransferase [Brevundimonas lenta]MBB4084134.1 sugar O-acyltransferase (sialic acid O-acetyltransferase NeuD family) [Brevundimonas lenta]